MHKPDKWTVVAYTDDVVVVFAMCICGDDECHFTASVGKANFIHIPRS